MVLGVPILTHFRAVLKKTAMLQTRKGSMENSYLSIFMLVTDFNS